MPSASSLFFFLFVSEIYLWKYSRNALAIFVDFLYAKTKYQTERVALEESHMAGAASCRGPPLAGGWGPPLLLGPHLGSL